MDQWLQVELISKAARAYVAAIEVPSYDDIAVRRCIVAPARQRPPLRPIATVLAALVVVLVFAVNARSVVAQVERVLRAFTIAGGRATPVSVSDVTLAQARNDAPFEVIDPHPIPPAFAERIDEIGSPDDGRTPAQIVFQYTVGTAAPAITIVETQATRGVMPQSDVLMYGPAGKLPAAPPLPPLPGRRLFGQIRNGSTGTRIELQTVTWIAHGTRITLLAAPGALSGIQLAAIERAMSL